MSDGEYKVVRTLTVKPSFGDTPEERRRLAAAEKAGTLATGVDVPPPEDPTEAEMRQAAESLAAALRRPPPG